MSISFAKVFCSVIVRIYSLFYSYKMSKKIHHLRDVLYTYWITSFIKNVGDNSIITYPCNIEGGGNNIIIGDKTSIGAFSVLGCWKKYGNQSFTPEIYIGANCQLGEYNHITAIKRITIGDGLLTGRFVYIGDNNHGGLSRDESDTPPAKRKLETKGEVVIGNNVWIGDKSTILGGVTIGDNVIIAANSVVTKNVPSNCLAAGVPAVIVKDLDAIE